MISPLASIHPEAKLAGNVTVEAFAVVEADVVAQRVLSRNFDLVPKKQHQMPHPSLRDIHYKPRHVTLRWNEFEWHEKTITTTLMQLLISFGIT